MAPFKAFACFSIYYALSFIVTSNAQPYSYISTDMMDRVYTAAGYKETDYVQKWIAEGNAIYRVLNYIYTIFSATFIGEDGEIEFIFASTGAKTCSYIYGEAERLQNKDLPRNEKPSKIIVVYTLNYVSELELAVQEYLHFKVALAKLSEAGAMHQPQIPVVVKQFRPVANGTSKLFSSFDYISKGSLKMETEQEENQHFKINVLHNRVKVNKAEIIEEEGFSELLQDTNIRIIVDGVAETNAEPVDVNNQLLMAIPRAQIRIMTTAIIWLKKKEVKFIVISNYSPSGMRQDGEWTIHGNFKYPVDIILSCLWHLELVNSPHFFLGRPMAVALDITYNSRRLIDELWKIISQDPKTNPELKADVGKARKGVFTFAPNPSHNQMCVTCSIDIIIHHSR